MTIAYRNEEMLNMVSSETGTVDRRIFSDRDIYELELERIFARAWNFMCHDSQIPNPGDFFMTVIGEDRVIVVRDNDGDPQVLVNTCRHRGNAICRADEGHATSFMCTYHGWTYDLKGALVGVPGFKEVYHEELDRQNWGLIKAAQVDTYKGFIFANMDPEAPSFPDYLGEVGRMALDSMAERGDEITILGGVQKYIIPCNWKLAADNVWDYYHGISHQSAMMSGSYDDERLRSWVYSKDDYMVIPGEYGHAIGGPQITDLQQVAMEKLTQMHDWRERPQAKQVLGPVGMKHAGHPQIFPNCWLTFVGLGQISMRMPKGPNKTEVWWFTFVDKATPEKHPLHRGMAIHVFGPAGSLEQDDGENWTQSTMGMVGKVSGRYPLNYSMNLGRGEIINEEGGPPHIYSKAVNEHPQLWHYRAWADWMSAESWNDLKANHTLVPEDKL